MRLFFSSLFLAAMSLTALRATCQDRSKDINQINTSHGKQYSSRITPLPDNPMSTLYRADSIMRWRPEIDRDYEEADVIIGRQVIYYGQGYTWDVYLTLDSDPTKPAIHVGRAREDVWCRKDMPRLAIGGANELIVWKSLFNEHFHINTPQKFRYHYSLVKKQYRLKLKEGEILDKVPDNATLVKTMEIKTPVYYYP